MKQQFVSIHELLKILHMEEQTLYKQYEFLTISWGRQRKFAQTWRTKHNFWFLVNFSDHYIIIAHLNHINLLLIYTLSCHFTEEHELFKCTK